MPPVAPGLASGQAVPRALTRPGAGSGTAAVSGTVCCRACRTRRSRGGWASVARLSSPGTSSSDAAGAGADGLTGADALRYKPTQVPRLSATQCETVKAALLAGPQAHGFSTPLWTLERVATLIERQTGVAYSVGHVLEGAASASGLHLSEARVPGGRAGRRGHHALEGRDVAGDQKGGTRKRPPG